MTNSTSPTALCDIDSRPVIRLSTGYDTLDWIYGSSDAPDNSRNWGLPLGATSLWAGAAGSGKSRLAIAIAANISGYYPVLYLQNEVSLSQFRSWVSGYEPNSQNFFVSETDSIETLGDVVSQVLPTLIVIDSISMLDGIDRPSQAKQIIMGIRQLAECLPCHIILIGHLNARGKVRGGTLVPHAVDTVVSIQKGDYDWIEVNIPNKHRYGVTGRDAVFSHERRSIHECGIYDDTFGFHDIFIERKTGSVRRTSYIGGRTQHVDEDGKRIWRAGRLVSLVGGWLR